MSRLFLLSLALLHLVCADGLGHNIYNGLDNSGQTSSPNSRDPRTTSAQSRTHQQTPTSTTRNVAFSSVLPTAKPTNEIAAIDLNFSLNNHTFNPINIDGHDVSVTCITCTSSGHWDISASNVHFDDNVIQDIHRGSLGFSGGHLRLSSSDGFSGRVQMSVPVFSSIEFIVPLVKIPLVGFVIPDGGEGGVTLEFGVPIKLRLPEPATLTFGFEWSLPPYFSLDIPLIDLKASAPFGFSQPNRTNGPNGLQVSLLSTHLDKPNLDFDLEMGLQVELFAGINLLDSDVVAEIGIQMDIPVNIAERQLNGSTVDNHCNPLQNDTNHRRAESNWKIAADELENALVGKYTNIIPTIGAALYVFAEDGLEFNEGGHKSIGFNPNDDVATIFSGILTPLPTLCVNNSPSSTATSMSTTSTSHTTSASSQSKLASSTTTTSAAATTTASHSGSNHASLPMSTHVALPLLMAISWLVSMF